LYLKRKMSVHHLSHLRSSSFLGRLPRTVLYSQAVILLSTIWTPFRITITTYAYRHLVRLINAAMTSHCGIPNSFPKVCKFETLGVHPCHSIRKKFKYPAFSIPAAPCLSARFPITSQSARAIPVRTGKRRAARSKPDWSCAIMNSIVEEGGEDSCGCVNMIPAK